MQHFWTTWAAYEVEQQWPVYGTGPFPGVREVHFRTIRQPCFLVLLNNGETFEVRPSCIVEPVIRREDGSIR